MSKIKKMPRTFSNDTERLSDLIDRYEMMGLKVIRVKERARLLKSPEESEITCVRGFEVLAKTPAGVQIIHSALMMYPSVDGHRYGYIPATKNNLKKVPSLLSSRNLTLEDAEFLDYAIEKAKEKGLPLEYNPSVNEWGDVIDKEIIAKQDELKKLKEQLAAKELDIEIAELKAKLSVSDDDKKTKEEIKVVEEKPKVVVTKTTTK